MKIYFAGFVYGFKDAGIKKPYIYMRLLSYWYEMEHNLISLWVDKKKEPDKWK